MLGISDLLSFPRTKAQFEMLLMTLPHVKLSDFTTGDNNKTAEITQPYVMVSK